jgi:hypothetical protein
MRRILLALAVLLISASIFGVATPASAVTYPFCVAGGVTDTPRCDYENMAQCQASASGTGYCVMNPAYTANAPTESGARKRRR